jgi:hypothetical protein
MGNEPIGGMYLPRRQFVTALFGGLTASLLWPRAFARTGHPPLVFCCSPKNDLYHAVMQAGMHSERYDTAVEAIAKAHPGSGILILAEDYPEKTVTLAPQDSRDILKKHLRTYIEYSPGLSSPESSVAGMKPQAAELLRGVVSSPFFGTALPLLSIVSPQNCQYIPMDAQQPGMNNHLVLAKVAGFDTAVFGLPKEGIRPLLMEDTPRSLLIATTKLSCFVTARYGPHQAWASVWNAILKWLCREEENFALQPIASVRPTWTANAALPVDVERRSFLRGVQWYYDGRLLISPSWAGKLDEYARVHDRVAPGPSQQMTSGDGSLGVLEGYSSRIEFDGSQPMRWWVRDDCVAETAMTFAFAQTLNGGGGHARVASNLIDFIVHSKLATGSREDPSSQSYGLLGWNTAPEYVPGENGFDVYYGDDNCRSLLGMLTTSVLLGENRWQQRFWLAVLANFRLIGSKGQQEFRYDEAPLQKNGWRHYFDKPIILEDMNYQAYPWALFLWAYSKTGYEPFLERTLLGIRLTMEAYPDGWKASNSITSAQARLLLPLAWLVRVKPTEEHRSWLGRIAKDLLAHQDACGAIREWFTPNEPQGPPRSNEEYGTREGCLIQNNGDPVADLIYSMNFAFIGLHEAHWATGDAVFKEATDRMADFLVRAQVQSETHPELNGAWMRAFDFRSWEYWASNSDWGWGAWCTETGWIQSWIASTLALRLMNRSLWDIAANAPEFGGFDEMRRIMLPA